jgi:hypothetical protein
MDALSKQDEQEGVWLGCCVHLHVHAGSLAYAAQLSGLYGYSIFPVSTALLVVGHSLNFDNFQGSIHARSADGYQVICRDIGISIFKPWPR